MSEIGPDALQPTAAVPDRLSQQPRREPDPRMRRVPEPAAPKDRDTEPADTSDMPSHEIDSLA
jgi:hypothetical protein